MTTPTFRSNSSIQLGENPILKALSKSERTIYCVRNLTGPLRRLMKRPSNDRMPNAARQPPQEAESACLSVSGVHLAVHFRLVFLNIRRRV